MNDQSILYGLKVLELASVLAGPSVGQFFAELGADVVKVEAPDSGDVTRSWRTPGESSEIPSYFSCVNWGKRSISLDFKSKRDKEILDNLISKADVLIASFKPGSAQTLGLAYDQVKELNPSILYGQITGYGNDQDRVGYDAIIQAETGFMYLNSQPGGDPQKMPVALMDILAAHQLKEALLLALIRRMQSGKGSLVSVSLIEAGISSLANQATNYLAVGKDPVPTGSLHPNIAPYGEVFETRDHRKVLLAIGNNRQFFSLADLLGLAGLSRDSRFSENTPRVKHRTELFPLLQEGMRRFTLKQFLASCADRHIPAGEILTVGEALDRNPDMVLRDGALAGLRNFAASGLPLNQRITPPPALDADRESVLDSWLNNSL